MGRKRYHATTNIISNIAEGYHVIKNNIKKKTFQFFVFKIEFG